MDGFAVGQMVEERKGGRNHGVGVISGPLNENKHIPVKMEDGVWYVKPKDLRPVLTRPTAAEVEAQNAMKGYAPFIAQSDAYGKGWRMFACIERTDDGTDFNALAQPLSEMPKKGELINETSLVAVGMFGEYWDPNTGLKLYAVRCSNAPRPKKGNAAARK
jgi:hypothetical protein